MKISKIKGAWSIIVENVDGVVREMSIDKYGHPCGNLTVSDIKHHLTHKGGIDAVTALPLANSAYKRHESYRFSVEGKETVKEFSDAMNLMTAHEEALKENRRIDDIKEIGF